ncbi:MAG: alpha/beta fold hydrolase [Planctomycetota bacterium]
MSEERLLRGLVIVLPGVEGRGPLNEAICKGLDAGGVDWAIEIYDWTLPFVPLVNLRAEGRNRRKARELVERIRHYKTACPGRPVVLVGQSGGSAIGVWAAEQMPQGDKIDGLIMLAPALSPRYVLDEALSNCDRGIVSVHSHRDWLFLGLLTVVYGTMDGEHDFSAGMVGFEVPDSKARNSLYQKFHDVGWTSEMAWKGHGGMHLTSGAANFVASYVAPFVLADEWTPELFAGVLEGEAEQPATEPAAESRPADESQPAWLPKINVPPEPQDSP